jgi:hypothetical protein
MKPSDPTAVSKRFAAVLARGLARAEMEITEHFARIRALPIDEEPADIHPWFKGRPESRDADDTWLDDEEEATPESRPASIAVPAWQGPRTARRRRAQVRRAD